VVFAFRCRAQTKGQTRAFLSSTGVFISAKGTRGRSENEGGFTRKISMSMAENEIESDGMDGPGNEIGEKKANKPLRFIDVSVFSTVKATSCFLLFVSLLRFNFNLHFLPVLILKF